MIPSSIKPKQETEIKLDRTVNERLRQYVDSIHFTMSNLIRVLKESLSKNRLCKSEPNSKTPTSATNKASNRILEDADSSSQRGQNGLEVYIEHLEISPIKV